MLVSKGSAGIINITIDGQKVEQVKSFKYLGAILTEDGRCESEIRARIGMAKDAFSKRKELLRRKMSISVKKRIIKTVVWSVALYGCETWTMKKDEVRRLQAFEIWIWRRMERVSWKDKKTNEEVLKQVDEERSIIAAITQRKKKWIGHILRREGLLRDVIEGRMKGKRTRGRKRIGMIDDLKEGNSYERLKRRAEDRISWKCWTPRTCPMAEH